MSITKTLPLVFGIWVYPNKPESVKNTFPVLFDIIIEFGPYKSCPSYSLTNSAYEKSLEFTAIIDCLSKSAI